MSTSQQQPEISTKALAVRLLVLAVAMFGFGFLLVPLYDVFCEITGFGGKTNQTAATENKIVCSNARGDHRLILITDTPPDEQIDGY